jgi:ribosomal protein S18 acetylase RimI-like enzyme
MNIRVLMAADAAAFQALRLQGLRECPLAFASSYEEELPTPIAEVAKRLAVRGDRALFGAFDGGDVLGLVGVQREGMRKLAHKAFVWGMYVAPPARRVGTGEALLRAALSFASKDLGVRQVNLSVHAQNLAAIALYRGLGFEPFGIERACMCVDDELQDEMHMACVLPDRGA